MASEDGKRQSHGYWGGMSTEFGNLLYNRGCIIEKSNLSNVEWMQCLSLIQMYYAKWETGGIRKLDNESVIHMFSVKWLYSTHEKCLVENWKN